MPFHAARDSVVGLLLCLIEQFAPQKTPEQEYQKYHHERRAYEFGNRELPA